MQNASFFEARQNANTMYDAHLIFVMREADPALDVLHAPTLAPKIMRDAELSAARFILKCEDCGSAYLFHRSSNPLWCATCETTTNPVRTARK